LNLDLDANAPTTPWLRAHLKQSIKGERALARELRVKRDMVRRWLKKATTGDRSQLPELIQTTFDSVSDRAPVYVTNILTENDGAFRNWLNQPNVDDPSEHPGRSALCLTPDRTPSYTAARSRAQRHGRALQWAHQRAFAGSASLRPSMLGSHLELIPAFVVSLNVGVLVLLALSR